MIKPKMLSKIIAEEIYDELIEELKTNKIHRTNKLSEDYLEIRNKLYNAFINIVKDTNAAYEIDYRFGIELFFILNEYFNLDKNIELASDVNFWLYINMIVIPDLVYQRWRDTPSRFYKSSNRIWTQSLWWYIYLTWQGTKEETINTIKGLNTDTIVQLYERRGRGYDKDLTREIVKQLSRYDDSKNKIFRKVMVLNTFYNKNLEPKFYKGGYKGYVEMLFTKANEISSK